MCSVDDGDYPEFYNRTWVVARVSHSCYECRKLINRGEKYCRITGKWNSQVDTFKTCKYCMQAGGWLDRECGGWSHGRLEDELRDHADEYGYRCLYQLTAGVANGWSKKL